MASAESLAELATLPQARCHQLAGNLSEKFSLDLDGPFRLIVEVADLPVPRLSSYSSICAHRDCALAAGTSRS